MNWLYNKRKQKHLKFLLQVPRVEQNIFYFYIKIRFESKVNIHFTFNLKRGLTSSPPPPPLNWWILAHTLDKHTLRFSFTDNVRQIWDSSFLKVKADNRSDINTIFPENTRIPLLIKIQNTFDDKELLIQNFQILNNICHCLLRDI
jgi:hypothetical protein